MNLKILATGDLKKMKSGDLVMIKSTHSSTSASLWGDSFIQNFVRYLNSNEVFIVIEVVNNDAADIRVMDVNGFVGYIWSGYLEILNQG